MNNITKLAQIIRNSNNIVFFGGAGVSTESNIPDFRSSGGLYSNNLKYNYSPEEIISSSFLRTNPEIFFKFYKKEMIFENAKPNFAHKFLTKLEKMGKLKAIITQNIDGLHQKAKSQNVLELHGSVYHNYCVSCGKEYDLEYIMNFEDEVPRCECGQLVRPKVTLYEEALDMEVLTSAVDYIAKAEVLIVGGTSLVVYPAASLVNYFKGRELVLINRSTTPYDNFATAIYNESIAELFKKVDQELF